MINCEKYFWAFCSCICGLWKNLRQRNRDVQAGSSNFTTNCITRERNKHFWLTHVNRFINAFTLPNLYSWDSLLQKCGQNHCQRMQKVQFWLTCVAQKLTSPLTSRKPRLMPGRCPWMCTRPTNERWFKPYISVFISSKLASVQFINQQSIKKKQEIFMFNECLQIW